MAGTHGYIGLPPDGTGKQVPQSVMLEFDYNNGTVQAEKGDTVTFSTTTGITGTVLEVDGIVSGEMHIRIEEPVPNPIPSLTVGENIVINAVTVATVNSTGNAYYFQQVVMVGKDMTHPVNIDERGSMFTRFSEGSPQFDAFGKIQISEATTIGEDKFSYDAHLGYFTDTVVSGGSLAHQPDHAGILLSCNTTATSEIKRISDRYFTYQGGKSQLIELTTAMGDSGKTNVTRMWGYGDDDDGCFFMLEDTAFKVMVRNSSTGSVVETKIDQADWNGDIMDGTGSEFNPSGFDIDLTKDNIYWIDLQWLGAGRIRFGCVREGKRITMHNVYNANLSALPYMRTGTLPIQVRQYNTGTSGSTSEMKVWCMVVKSEGEYDPPMLPFSGRHTKTVTTPVSIMTFRARQTFKTLDNRTTAYGRYITGFTDTDPVVIEIVKNATLGGTPSFANPDTDSAVEFDTAGTTVTGGTVIASKIIPVGREREIDLSHIFTHIGETMNRKATITDDPDTYTIMATRLSGTTTGVTVTADWQELQQ